MTADLAMKIQRVAAREGIDIEIYEDYSGRGMYGKTTTAITVSDKLTLRELELDTAATYGTEIVKELSALRTDSLGQDVITY